MKKIVLKLLMLVCLIGLPIRFADARSGCCSHHGGVCGCQCCDGSSLSSTCAPYYPSCSRPVYKTSALNTPTPTPIYTPIITPRYNPIISNISSTTDTSEEDNSGAWWTIGILGILGYVYYKIKKK